MTEQLPETNGVDDALNEPVPLLVPHVMVPVGFVPVTLAVHVTCEDVVAGLVEQYNKALRIIPTSNAALICRGHARMRRAIRARARHSALRSTRDQVRRIRCFRPHSGQKRAETGILPLQ